MRSSVGVGSGGPRSTAALQAEVVDTEGAISQLLARRAALLAELDSRGSGLAPDAAGVAMPLASWLRDATGMALGAARRAVDVARGLDALPAVRAACLTGQLRIDRAEVLALRLVPHVPAHAVAAAEGPLLDAARLCEPAALTARIRAWVADHLPDTFADAEARAPRWVQLDPLSPGRWSLHGVLDAPATEVLRTALAALAAKTDAHDHRSARERRADGLVALAQQALDAGALPATGGLRPQVTIVVAAGTLFGLDGPAARADHTGPIARPHLLALTCDAELLLARLAADGRLVSLHSGARAVPDGLRRAINARDRGCVHRGCDTPAAACHAHHVQHWADGGPTSIDNLALLCPRHHAAWHRGTVHRHHLRLPGDPPPPARHPGEERGDYFLRLLATPHPTDPPPRIPAPA